ncbi:MAG: hypothetical protein AAF600_10920 [Bacteroidota bacterium]
MSVKYRISYTSVNNIEYQCDFSNPTYLGEITELEGNVIYGMAAVDDMSHPLRTKTLNITVTASTEQPLVDLVTLGERYWRVEFYRDGNKIFFGYLTTETPPQNFNADKWPIELEALCPMGFLEDLAYVDLLGNPYEGDEQLAKIISNCLKLGFEQQNEAFNILSYANYDYRIQSLLDDSFTEFVTGRFLKDVQTDQDQYFDEESQESTGCQEVLVKILSALQLTVTQINGDTWLISHYLFDQSVVPSLYINSFDKDGNDISDISLSPFSNIDLKTDSIANGPEDVTHVNTQDFYYDRGFQKLVADFQYRFRNEMLENPSFDNGINGVSMPGWAVGNDYSESTDQGFVKILKFDLGVNTDDFAMRSAGTVAVTRFQRLLVKGSFLGTFENPVFRFGVLYKIPGQSDRTLRFTQEQVPYWSETTGEIGRVSINGNEDQVVSFDYELPEVLDFGELEMYVYAARNQGTLTSADSTTFIELYDLDFEANESFQTGISHILSSTDNRSLKSEKIEINFSTGRTGILSNALYKLSLGDPIQAVRDNGISGNYAPLEFNLIWNKLRNKRLKKFFNGDFYNFYEPHKYIRIPDLDSETYVPIEYSFDTKSNVGAAKYEQKITSSVGIGDYTVEKLYGNTIQPKIVQ